MNILNCTANDMDIV
jgi:hypothetical protein